MIYFHMTNTQLGDLIFCFCLVIMDISKVWIALPAYNESKRIVPVLRDLQDHGYKNIIVCDDGSKDNTGDLCRQYGALVVRHHINIGSGPATQTAIDVAQAFGAEYIICMDSDGQHQVADIARFIEAFDKDPQLQFVIGSRFLHGDLEHIPFSRRVVNRIANVISFIFSGVWVSDCQSGFRGYHKSAVAPLTINTPGYEFSLEVLRKVGYHKIRRAEVPISVIYFEEWNQRGQSMHIAISMVFRTFLRSIFS